MTIVHIITGFGLGGAENVMLELAKKSRKDNKKCIIISVADIKDVEFRLIKNNLEFYYLGINSSFDIIHGLKKLKSILKNQNDAVLHCHMFHAVLIASCYNIFIKKTPLIFTLHNSQVSEVYRRYLLFFTKILRNADINFSKSTSKWYLKNTHVIANGVDFESFQNNKQRYYNIDEPFKFLFLGRISEQKNPLFLIDLVKLILTKGYKNFIIQIAGDGELRQSLEQEISNNKLESHLKLLGFQKDTRQCFDNSHCMILPSLWEGLPISLIEASAAKLPIITTPVGSIPDFFNSSNTFISTLDNFHLAMIDVMDEYQKALEMADKLFNDNKALFDINCVYKQHLEVYSSVFGESK